MNYACRNKMSGCVSTFIFAAYSFFPTVSCPLIYVLFLIEPIYVFHSEEKQKSIDIESICQLLDLVLGPHFRAQVDYFIEYLKVSG